MVPGPEAITNNQKEYISYHQRAQVHPALQATADETMTRRFELPNTTYAEKGAKDVFLATSPDEKVRTICLANLLI